MKKEKVSISVHQLIEFALQSGDIMMGITSSFRSIEGIKGHKELQKTRGELYKAEVPLSVKVESKHVILKISGKADGILLDETGLILEEIKTTELNPSGIEEDAFPLHWAQARIYGYMLLANERLPGHLTSCEAAFPASKGEAFNNKPDCPGEIILRLTYYNRKTKKICSFQQLHTRELLLDFFDFVSSIYIDWLESISLWNEEKHYSIKKTVFPFSSYRKGQREMAVAVYRRIRDGGSLFVQAPTGIGKTLGVLFPAIKAQAEQHAGKIFYLTARTIARTVAEESLDIMRKTGLRIKSVTLTAKQKMCFLKEQCVHGRPPCKPELCSYARGHYSRVRKALEDIYSEEGITCSIIEEYAEKHHVCPFEFSLDIALWVDIIICDYNYVFDPRVQLKRFFQAPDAGYVFLVDESHNLPERAREMFSAELMKKSVLSLKRKLKKTDPDLSLLLDKINKKFLALRKKIPGYGAKSREHTITIREAPEKLGNLVKDFIKNLEWKFKWKKKNTFPEELFDFYFTARVFLKTLETYDKKFITFVETTKNDVKITLYCIDPSTLLAAIIQKGKAAIFFSATLTPASYYITLSGGDAESNKQVLPSPFPAHNLLVLIDGSISTRYRDREKSYGRIASHIYNLIRGRIGNYLVFFPSYAYLREVLDHFSALTEEDKNFTIVYQEPGMTEKEREEFLHQFTFKEGHSLAGFAVMGGIFGEGIDLKGNRLSGAVIVGVGLPRIGQDRDVIKNYFNEQGKNGFDFAYMYPGLNRVLQAAGRVIRSEEDKGVILLIDDRFLSSRYRRILPREWQPVRINNSGDIAVKVREFYR